MRPKSLIAINSAAIACFFTALEKESPILADVRQLMDGIMKSRTIQPLVRSKVMPRKNFQDLFNSWPENDMLSLEMLRLKTVTLLALTGMLRPSDLAPQAIIALESGRRVMQFTLD